MSENKCIVADLIATVLDEVGFNLRLVATISGCDMITITPTERGFDVGLAKLKEADAEDKSHDN